MSKKQRAIQRRATAQATPSGGVLIPQHIIAQAMAQMKQNNSVKGNTDLFSPGEPMTPQKGTNPNDWPRGWNFPIAYNTSSPDRTLQKQEIPSFEQLRNLAELYEGIGLCERVWLDLIPGLQLKIQVRPELQAQGVEIDKYQAKVKAITQLFKKPDGIRNMHSWLRMAIIEQTQIDALCIFKQRDKMGRLQSLKIVDGSTIKPLLDDWGNPLAYQQFPWGIPGDIFTMDQMVYFTETPRANTPYGKSRVERIMMRVNQALRKEKKDLAHFTEGNQPFALMEVPEASNWTPDQIEVFEQMWNSLIAGNEQQQVRVKFTQAGMKYTPLEQYQLLSDFDQFILNIATADYGLSMSDLSFTGDIHKSSDKGQQNMLYRRTLGPIVNMYGGILTDIIEEDFDEPDLIATFGGYEEEDDLKSQAEAYEILINSAVVSPATAAHALKQPQIPETGPLFVTQSGIIPLSNYEEGSEFRKASDDAQLAGFKLAANPQQPQPGQEDMQGDESATTKPGKQSPPTAKANQDEEEDDPKERAADLRRWKKRAIEDVKAGKAFRGFSTTYIPDALHAQISTSLERCTTVEEVHGVFERATLPIQHWQDFDPLILDAMAKMKGKGVVSQTWNCRPDACDDCLLNQGATVPLYSRFPNGAMTTPCHGNCECGTTQNKKVEVHA